MKTITTTRQTRRVVLSSMVGSTVEYYDFAIYGTGSSLVFGKLFFPSLGSVAGTLVSLSTFGVAFVARPIGAAIFGHFGDRIGRKRMLVLSLLMMGVGTLTVGVLPTYAQVGVMAPILLVAARLMQDFALSGEQTGGYLMSIESVHPNRRGFIGSLVNSSAGWGLLLSDALYPMALS